MKTALLFILSSAALCLAAGAQTVAVNPAADTFTSAASPNSNYGGAGALELSGAGTSNGEFDTFMQFNLSSAAGINVQAITLQLTAMTPNNSLFNANAAGQFQIIWMVNSSWVEGTGTPLAPTTNGLTYAQESGYLTPGVDENLGTFSFPGGNSGASTYTLPLDSGLVSAITSGSEVSLELLPVASSMSFLMGSRTNPTTAARPLFTVTAVPEPGSMLLCLGGVLAMAAVAKYRRCCI